MTVQVVMVTERKDLIVQLPGLRGYQVVPVDVCLTCGAVVFDVPRHDRWHRSIALAEGNGVPGWEFTLGARDTTPSSGMHPCEDNFRGYLCSRHEGHQDEHAAGDGDTIVAVWRDSKVGPGVVEYQRLGTKGLIEVAVSYP